MKSKKKIKKPLNNYTLNNISVFKRKPVKEEELWEKIQTEDCLPEERSKHTTVVYEDSLFVYGGKSLKGMTSDVYEFKIPESKWIKHSNTKGLKVHSHSSVVSNNKMYVFGGKNEKDEPIDTLQAFDFKTKEFKVLKSHFPSVSGHGSVADGNKIYVFGGVDVSDNSMNVLYSYDIKLDEWKKEKLNGKITGVSNFQMTIAGKDIFIIGGITEQKKTSNALYKINLYTFNVIKEKVENPVRVTQASLVKLNEDELMIIGGTINDQSTVTEMWIYKIEEKCWDQVLYDGLTRCYCQHTCVLYFNQIYLFGGNSGITDSNDLFTLKIQNIGTKILLYKDDFSDCQIKIGSDLFPGHKTILFQSKNFKDELLENSTLDLSQYDPYLIHRVLKYMYGFKLQVNGDELFSLVKLSKKLNYDELQVHCTSQLTDMKPEYILDLLAKTEDELRNVYNERFYAKDVMKIYCLEKFQEIGHEKFFDSKETYQKFESLSDDLKMELIVTANINSQEDSILPEDKDRTIQIREHFSKLLSEKICFDCVLKSKNFEFQSHKLLFYSSPYFVKEFKSKDTINFDDQDEALKLLYNVAYDPSIELNDEEDELFEEFSKKYGLDFTQSTSSNKIKWDCFQNNFVVEDKECKRIKQTGSNPRMAFTSYQIKKGMRDVEIAMKINYVSWVGVGVCEGSKVELKDFSWNYSGGYDKHGTNLWSMNGYTWTTNANTHQKSGKPSYSSNDIIELKICTKEQVLKMKRSSQQNWEVELPIQLPVCFCVNLGGSGDWVEILPKNYKK
eukprot:gene626-8130_t